MPPAGREDRYAADAEIFARNGIRAYPARLGRIVAGFICIKGRAMTDKETPMTEKQPMTVKTITGATVEIPVEQWIKNIINEAIKESYERCPLNSRVDILEDDKKEDDLKTKVSNLELKMKIVQWAGGTISALSIAHIINTLAGLVK